MAPGPLSDGRLTRSQQVKGPKQRAPTADRHVEGVVEMMLDATQHCDQALNAERLFGWHASLFSGQIREERGDYYRILEQT
jgi:hypothetical protein